MTVEQRNKYFRLWHQCCLANGWRMKAGRLLWNPESLSDEGRQVVALATQRAVQEHRSVTVDDLRHGCSILALKRDKSSKHFTNADLDRVFCLFRLLTNPLDLRAITEWQAYARGEDPGSDKRSRWRIGKAPSAYAGQVSADMYGTRNIENLNDGQRRNLAGALRQRQENKRSRKLETADCPF